MQPKRAVNVVLIDASVGRLGIMVDVSVSGARIKLPAPLHVGQKCELILAEHQRRFGCTVIWADRSEMGVRFDDGDVTRTDH